MRAGETGVALERAAGRLDLAVRRSADGRHAIADLGQSGCGRLLFPARDPSSPLEAVVVNTGGGLTGGDRFDVAVRLGPGAQAVLTTQACEKIYAAKGSPARVSAKLAAGAGASLRWLPQETILFDRSALDRSLAIDMAADAEVLAAEAILLGRQAMGETLTAARLRDRWRIRRGGRLVFAEETAARPGNWAATGAPALLGGAAALATIVHVSPRAESEIDAVRAILEGSGIDGGASAFDGLLAVRLAAPTGLALRRTLVPILEHCGGRLPRVWMT